MEIIHDWLCSIDTRDQTGLVWNGLAKDEIDAKRRAFTWLLEFCDGRVEGVSIYASQVARK